MYFQIKHDGLQLLHRRVYLYTIPTNVSIQYTGTAGENTESKCAAINGNKIKR